MLIYANTHTYVQPGLKFKNIRNWDWSLDQFFHRDQISNGVHYEIFYPDLNFDFEPNYEYQ